MNDETRIQRTTVEPLIKTLTSANLSASLVQPDNIRTLTSANPPSALVPPAPAAATEAPPPPPPAQSGE